MPAHRSRGGRRVVSFDFDGTLTRLDAANNYVGPHHPMIQRLKAHAAKGDVVIITTARAGAALDAALSRSGQAAFPGTSVPLVGAFVAQHGLPVARAYFTGNVGKGPHLRRAGAAVHYDDQEGQRQSAEAHGVEARRPLP